MQGAPYRMSISDFATRDQHPMKQTSYVASMPGCKVPPAQHEGSGSISFRCCMLSALCKWGSLPICMFVWYILANPLGMQCHNLDGGLHDHSTEGGGNIYGRKKHVPLDLLVLPGCVWHGDCCPLYAIDH